MIKQVGTGKRARTRALILDTAARQFSQSGFSGTSMDALAKACGLTKGALYDHFDGKEDVYTQSVAAYLNEGIEAVLKRSLPREQGSAEECLFSFLECYLDSLQEDPVFRRLFLRVLTDSGDINIDAVTHIALVTPFKYSTGLLMQCRPKLNASYHIYSFLCSAILGEDMRKVAELLTPEVKALSTTSIVLEHFRKTLGES
jgi:AcrR family transcriptional regulator